jgi:hypothetical protein
MPVVVQPLAHLKVIDSLSVGNTRLPLTERTAIAAGGNGCGPHQLP